MDFPSTKLPSEMLCLFVMAGQSMTHHPIVVVAVCLASNMLCLAQLGGTHQLDTMK